MYKKNWWMPVLALFLVLTMALSACGAEPTATPVPPEPTEVPTVEEVEEPTEEPEPTPEPTPTEEPTPTPEPELDLEAVAADYLAGLPEGWGTIKVDALNELLAEEEIFMVDVRQPDEYAEGFIEGAVNIPLRELAQNLAALPAQDQDVVVICGSGFRSAIGMTVLQMLGYENAMSMVGGMQAWTAAELPVVTEPVPELVAGEEPEVDAQLLAAVDDYLMNVLPEGWGVIKTEGLLEELVEEPPYLLDVRQSDEFGAGAIEDAVNVPLRELGANLDQLPADQPIVAICGSGHRSTIAMTVLQMLGYEVKSLAGGMNAYNAAMVPPFDLAAELAGYFANLPEGWGVIKVDALNERLAEEELFMVDVRQPEEYEGGFIEGAVNIPLRELAQNLAALPALDQEVVVICGSGFRSAIGMAALQMLGYENALSMAGGMNAWTAAEFPAVTEPVPALAEGEMPDVNPDMLAAVDDYLMNVLPEGWGVIKPDGLAEALVEEPPLLLDVRSQEEFAGGHIEGAVNAPLRELGDYMDMMDMVPKDTPIVVICGSGHRSTIAMTGMQMMGFVNAKSLAGGMNGWIAAEYPVVTGFDISTAVDAYLSSLPEGWGVIKVEALNEQMIEAAPFIVDVRQPDEYVEGFIEGAINIPLRELAANLDALPALDEQIVVVCGSGFRSAIGMAVLQMLGYEDVFSMAGGMNAWTAAEFPVVTEPVPEVVTGEMPDVNADMAAAVADYLVNLLPEGWGVIKVEGLSEALVEEPPFILDVRQPDEFAGGYIEGAINVPLRELGQALDQLPADESIVVVCGSGHRSTIGMVALQMAGFGDVKSLAGGMNAWTAAELPVVTD
jgi:rhodanese-related sulfurtransferase